MREKGRKFPTGSFAASLPEGDTSLCAPEMYFGHDIVNPIHIIKKCKLYVNKLNIQNISISNSRELN